MFLSKRKHYELFSWITGCGSILDLASWSCQANQHPEGKCSCWDTVTAKGL